MNLFYRRFFCLLISLSSFDSWAQSNICNDLVKPTCSSRVFKDGTGEVRNGQQVKDLLKNYEQKNKDFLRERFEKIFQEPRSREFRNSVWQAIGLNESDDCVSNTIEVFNRCNAKAISALVQLGQKSSLGVDVSDSSLDDLNMSDIYPVINSEFYNQVIGESRQKIYSDFSDPELENRIKNKVFPQVKNLMLAKIKSLPIEDSQKKIMLQKIEEVNYTGNDCSALTDGTKMSQLLEPNAGYIPTSKSVILCQSMKLRGDSEFMLAFVLAHELAHSIDPCIINNDPRLRRTAATFSQLDEEYQIPGLLECLREDSSIGAKKIQYIAFEGEIESPYEKESRSYCGDSNTKDQINEAFSDWLAAEILPVYIKNHHQKLTRSQKQMGYANVFKINCDHQQSFDEDIIHPPVNRRVNRILLTNPEVRKQIGCSVKHPEFRYCGTAELRQRPPRRSDQKPILIKGDQSVN